MNIEKQIVMILAIFFVVLLRLFSKKEKMSDDETNTFSPQVNSTYEMYLT